MAEQPKPTTAATFLAQAIRSQGITVAFGIVGIPVTQFAEQLQKEGIKFIAMRNEQAASYAASVYGYLTGTPAICLTVSGPGLVHALPGLLNATTNCWPMILISSTSYASHKGRGGFQEVEQTSAAQIYAKHCVKIDNFETIGLNVQSAFKHATYGQQGGVYIEVSRELLESNLPSQLKVPAPIPPAPKLSPLPEDLNKALGFLASATKPLVIIGKGAANARAESELLEFVNLLNVPFLPSPMGKGTVSDSHPLCVSPARALCLSQADVILVVGARMNWMFDFGQKFAPNSKLIQVDVAPESFHPSAFPLCGDARVIISELTKAYKQLPKESEAPRQTTWQSWRTTLSEKVEANKKAIEGKYSDKSNPMKYHYVLGKIRDSIPKDAIIVNEGANTMDIGRLVLTNEYPRSRLDAGTLATMGVGVGYAIAAAVAFPQRKVIVVQGDSAFGFSGMEIEVACRYNLPITFIVLNNNGIYRGAPEIKTADPTLVPPTLLMPNTHYEKLIEAFGGVGFFSDNSEDVEGKIKEAVACPKPCLLSINIDPFGPIPTIVQGGTPH